MSPEPENKKEIANSEEETQIMEEKEVSRLHQITPLSKYLTLALFIILPFLGAYIGYINAPEKVMEVEKVVYKNDENAQVSDKCLVEDCHQDPEMSVAERISSESFNERDLFTREELIENEIELMKEYDIEIDETIGTANLYRSQDIMPDSLYSFEGKGLSLLLPYNKGWGWPHYRLTPYDLVGDVLQYGEPNPCPAGCSGSGAHIFEVIEFHPVDKSLEEIVGDDTNYDPDSCIDVQINQSVSAKRCWGDGMAFEHAMVIEGSKYKYEFRNWPCQDDISYYENNSDLHGRCLVLNQSIRVK